MTYRISGCRPPCVDLVDIGQHLQGAVVLSLVNQELWAVGHPDHGDGDEQGGDRRNDRKDSPRAEAVRDLDLLHLLRGDDDPGERGNGDIADHPKGGERAHHRPSPRLGLELDEVRPDERYAAADAEPAEEPPDDEGVLGAGEGGGEAAGKVDDHGDDEGLAAAVHVAEAAPDVAADEHAEEHDGADDALVGGGEAELAAGGGEEEGDAEDLDGVRGVGPPADEEVEVVEAAEAGVLDGVLVVAVAAGVAVLLVVLGGRSEELAGRPEGRSGGSVSAGLF